MRKLILFPVYLLMVGLMSANVYSKSTQDSTKVITRQDSSLVLPDTSKKTIADQKQKTDSIQLKQKPDEPKKLDKIIRLNGDELNVTIKEKNIFEVKFYTEGSKKLQVLSTSVIKEIHYANGRVEVLDTTPEKRKKDWVGKTSTKQDSTPKTEEEESSDNTQEPLDTIVKQNGRKLLAHVQEKNVLEVKYRLPKGKTVYSMGIANVKEIHYSDGRIVAADESPEKKPKDWTVARAVKDWEEVVVTYNQDDVASELVEKGPIEVEYTPEKFNATNEFLEKSAIVVAKKKASKMKATIVLITEKNFDRQYGELPSVTLKGVAYGKP